MYARLEDELLDHPKIWQAGRTLGRNGRAIALGFYVHALLYCNRFLNDGYLPVTVIEGFGALVLQPLVVAEALAKAGLFDTTEGGYRIHDFTDYNPTAAAIKHQRKEARTRQARYRAGRGNGRAR